MNDLDIAQQLHDKATRGGSLSSEELAKLNEWYAREDRNETALLARNDSEMTMAELDRNIDAALVAHLTAVTQLIQTVTAENESLRRDIAALHQRLAQMPQPA